ncbi:hypothetical protein GGH91_001000 [Coemansia sp. RSA 2671]|nr:hypothetical protein LPJ60_002573 [Coemansia sp. RSA 2675]KAJ2349113.1 hypothetical protein GGH91_001000 [Coemansia sp. RSA 2671]
MGKRKSSRKVAKKEQPKLDTTFACLFCSHEKSVSVAMNRKIGIGSLKCKVCSATYQAALNPLSDAIDVYSEWIDACEEAKRQETISLRATTATTTAAPTAQAPGRRRQESSTASVANKRPGKDAAVGRYDDDDDDDDDDEDDNGYYDDAGRGRQREAVRAPAQLTDESDIDDF